MENRDLGKVWVLLFVISLTTLIPFNYDDSRVAISASNEIRVMNFNLHFGVEVNEGYDLEGFRNVILDVEPNIVGFQEITSDYAVNGFANMIGEMTELMKDIGFEYSYIQEERRSKLRNALFSQYEIVSGNTYYYDIETQFTRSLLDVELTVNGVATNVIITHITHLPVGETGEDRIDMIAELFTYIDDKPTFQNIIVMGDFNAQDSFPEYSIMTSTFIDAWNSTHPNELGATFHSDREVDKDVTETRIDYILVSPDITVNDCAVTDTDVSDHRPINCDIVLS